jgi:hypothetical protein
MRILICALALSSLAFLSPGPLFAQGIGVEVTPGPGIFREKGDRGRDFDRGREDRSRKEFGRDDESHGGNCKTAIVREGGTTKKIKRCGN